ncbi:lipopolysaccharide transport periplasmic protein LptA [Aquabacterium sp. A08]|uniref:lipopolysaccharide transport periplasmic protein LptA n=1 Tax=Aquabacterium sp. A08 TaxID=2718532 RepID=UPI0014233946|nr:lipopolysaccharide transport periplasmic protein LptA [Aquabacterium sp. A08]NIC43281.1 lipopolysaccharide transport periplasmic protein LptA [Aquabacterium sp. A08]
MTTTPPRHARALRAALLAAALAGGLSAPALAERADRLQAMNIEADALRYDDARQTSVFTGNVVITKGSIVIRGQQVDVLQDAQNNQFSTVLGREGQRAFFRQKREGLEEFIEGEALRIDYDSQADTVKFIGQAVLRRYRGATLSDQTSGGTIVYDNRTEVFTVDAGGASRSPDNPGGRVRAMLTPNPAAGNADAAGTPPPRLQPSPRLESRP